MNKKIKKIFGTIIVALVAIGLVAAYIPLLFVRPEQIPQRIGNQQPQQQQVAVPLAPRTSTSTPTPAPTSTIEGITVPEGFFGIDTENQSLGDIEDLLNGQ